MDDHFVIAVVDEKVVADCSGEDYDLVMRSHAAYAAHSMERAPEKGYGFSRDPDANGEAARASTHFTVLGTEVAAYPGVVGTGLVNRAELMLLIQNLIVQPLTEKSLLRRALALFTHPFMHRRCLMAVFRRVYKWMTTLVLRRLVP